MAIAENQITLEIVADGQDGSGVSVDVDYNITDVIEEYAIGTESAATGVWGTEVPDLTEENPKLWYRQKVIWADESITYEPDASGTIKKQIVDSGLDLSDRVETIEETVDDKVDKTTYDEDSEAISENFGAVNSSVTAIQETASQELVKSDFAKISDYDPESANPLLTLGRENLPWKVVIRNNAISLQKDKAEVAYLAQDIDSPKETMLKADNARLANLRLRSTDGRGLLGIVAQSNGHVSLKEI